MRGKTEMKKTLRFVTSVLLTLSMLSPSAGAFGSFAASGEAGEMITLDGLKGLGGNWSIGETVSSGGSGDNFALSESRAENFVFEADIKFVNRTGAASLVFLSSDDPSHGSYVANIDLSAGNARIFRFESSGGATTKGEYVLSAGQKESSSFRLRVEVLGDCMNYFIDGIPVVSVNDSSPAPGNRLGLLTFNTTVEYSDVRWAPLSENSPEIISVSGLSSSFSGQTVMKETLPYGTKEMKLSVGVKGGGFKARAYGADVSVQGNDVVVSNISESFKLVISAENGELVRSYVITVKVDADPSSVYNEQWRQQLHFSPYVNWLNDPNGLVYDPSDETWHLFFQYNPYGLNIANQVWGHAVSSDLMHWKETDIAIPQDHLGAVFSGSAVVDEENTTGFFTDNKPGESKLVALYTSDGGDTTHGVEKQCIAYSKDHGKTWIRPSVEVNGFENPVISNQGNKYGRDFRDPKIFWYDDKWFMVVAGGRARLFTSDNLIDWTMVCDIGFDSECPDFYPLAVDGNEDNVKWVYTASGKWYVIGRLEKISDTQYKFVAESERLTYNGGPEVYATQSYFNDGSGLNRRIAISWIQDSSAASLPGKTWNGAMTLPLEQKLCTIDGKLVLTSYPVAELDELRSEKPVDIKSPSLSEAGAALESNPGNAYDLVIAFKPETGSELTLNLRSNGENCVQVVYDDASNSLRVIRGKASRYSGSIPSGTMEMPLYPGKDGIVTLRIVMDTTAIEVFGNEGEAACSGLIFPESDAINSSLCVDGNVEIVSLEMWRMTSIWHFEEEIVPEPGVYFDAEALTVEPGDFISVTAYLIDENGNRSDGMPVWDNSNDSVAEILPNENGTVTIKGLKDGKAVISASFKECKREITIAVSEKKFNSNLSGWTSAGDWYEDENGWSIAGSSGDSFTFSDGKNEGEFTYTAEADFNGRGGCLGLVFGATNPENPKSGTWYGANIDTYGSSPVIKLFCNTNGTEVWNETYTLDATNEKWVLSVSYDSEGILEYTVDGISVSRWVSDLPSGGLGLVSWNGGGSFNNVNYSSGTGSDTPQDDPSDTDDTDVPGEKPEESSDTTAGVDDAMPQEPDVTTSPSEDTKDVAESLLPDTGDENEKGSGKKTILYPVIFSVAGVAVAAGIAVVAVFFIRKKRS